MRVNKYDDLNGFFFRGEMKEYRLGFDDLELLVLCKKSPLILNKIKEVSELGFKYIGDNGSDSKAFTDVSKKRIFIGKDKSVKDACLSLAYELVNATNKDKIAKLHERYLFSEGISNNMLALSYARDILKVEVEAVYFRTIIAINHGLENSLKNKKYVEIVRENLNSQEITINLIHEEMINNGFVCNGSKKAVDYYKEQYFQYKPAFSVGKKVHVHVVSKNQKNFI